MSLPTILLILAALSIGATIIVIIIAFRSDREAKSAIFPIIREEEAVRAQRARVSVFVWAAITALFIGGWLASLRLGLGIDAESMAEQPNETTEAAVVAATPQSASPDIESEALPLESAAEVAPTEEPTATPLPIEQPPTETPPPVEPVATPVPSTDSQPSTDTPLPPTNTPAPSDTLSPPTATPTHTSTPEPTATPLPTDTPTPPLASLVRAPTNAPRTPAPSGARMGPIQFATEISPQKEAINPDDTFTEGVEAVYAVFPYKGMENGVDFKVIWYQDGQELWREESEWEWGDEARFYSFITSPNEGLYKLELVVNDSVLATDLFEIR